MSMTCKMESRQVRLKKSHLLCHENLYRGNNYHRWTGRIIPLLKFSRHGTKEKKDVLEIQKQDEYTMGFSTWFVFFL